MLQINLLVFFSFVFIPLGLLGLWMWWEQQRMDDSMESKKQSGGDQNTQYASLQQLIAVFSGVGVGFLMWMIWISTERTLEQYLFTITAGTVGLTLLLLWWQNIQGRTKARLLIGIMAYLFYAILNAQFIPSLHQREYVHIGALGMSSLILIVSTLSLHPAQQTHSLEQKILLSVRVLIQALWWCTLRLALAWGIIFLSLELFTVLDYQVEQNFERQLELLQQFFLLGVPTVMLSWKLRASLSETSTFSWEKGWKDVKPWLQFIWGIGWLITPFVVFFTFLFLPLNREAIEEASRFTTVALPYLALVLMIQLISLRFSWTLFPALQRFTRWQQVVLALCSLVLTSYLLWSLGQRIDQYALTYNRLLGWLGAWWLGLGFFGIGILHLIQPKLEQLQKKWLSLRSLVKRFSFAWATTAIFLLLLLTSVLDGERWAVRSQLSWAESEEREDWESLDRFYLQALDSAVAEMIKDRFTGNNLKMKADIVLTLQEMKTDLERSGEEYLHIDQLMADILAEETNPELISFINFTLASEQVYTNVEDTTLCANQVSIMTGFRYADAYSFCDNSDIGYEIRYIERPDGIVIPEDDDGIPEIELEGGELVF